MARVNTDLRKTEPWDGRKGWQVTAVHSAILDRLGVETFRRDVDNHGRAGNWFYAPAQFALLSPESGPNLGGGNWAANVTLPHQIPRQRAQLYWVTVWAKQVYTLQEMDALLRLLASPAAYREQMHKNWNEDIADRWTAPAEGNVSRDQPWSPECWPYGHPAMHETDCRLFHRGFTLGSWHCDCTIEPEPDRTT